MIRLIVSEVKGGIMDDHHRSDSCLTDRDFKSIVEEGRLSSLPSEDDRTANGESFASVIDRHGVATFSFHRTTGYFHALNAEGQELASGRSVREILESL